MADTDKTYEILNYYGLKTNIEDTKKWIKQYVAEALTGITTDLMTNVTYDELVSLRDNNNLKPGMLYRMTDYVTKVYSEDGSVSSAEHPFDLILFANATNSLNENAFACLNSNSDGYFDNCNINTWEIKYSLDNDDRRFEFGCYSHVTKIFTDDDDLWFTYIGTRKNVEDETQLMYIWYNENFDGDGSLDDYLFTFDGNPEIDGFAGRLNYLDNNSATIFDTNYSIVQDSQQHTENGKGVIYYMKDEFNNEAPFDFKNILFKDGDYIFGEFDVDFSLNGYANGIYNNKILPQVDSISGRQVINKIRVTKKDCHSNYFKPTCVNSYIDFPISECDISMNEDGELVIFKTQDFVSGIENKPIEHDYRKDYLTFEAVNDNTEIIFKTYTDDPQYTKTIEVSKDKVNWETKTSSSGGVILASLNAGEKLYLRGNNTCYAYYDDNAGEYLPNFILPLNDCYVYGNVMSLIDSNNFRTLTEITDDYTFFALFCDNWNGDYSGEYVLSHQDKKLVLPATTLADRCYGHMFNNCTRLTTAPELPATTLADSCYRQMFNNCTRLTTAPKLPATTLASGCYSYMFYGCSSLTTAPVLPATTLANNCYGSMFYGCTSLTTAPKLPATSLASGCYSGMFQNCTSLTTAPELPATTLANYCYNSMFYNCTNLTTAPVLPATTLASGCYQYMFEGCNSLTAAPALSATTLADRCYRGMFAYCSSLIEAPELPATTLANGCYQSMFSGCTVLTTAPELPATTLAQGCYSSMFYHCSGLTTATELPATTLASSCYSAMFSGCTSLTAAPELPATTLAVSCYSNMFDGCSSLTTVPELLATTLASGCYSYMFYGCSSLTTAPELPATILANNCYGSMFQGCSSLTTAPKLPATTLASGCYSYMFNNCSNLNYIKCLAVNGINTNNSTYAWVRGVASSGTFIKHPNATSWPTGNNGIPTNWTVEDVKPENYITFTALENNVPISLNRISSNQKLLYSTDDGETWSNFTTGMTITLENSGDTCYIAGMLSANNKYSDYTQFNLPNRVSVSGNINSLWNYMDLGQNLYQYCGFKLFSGCPGLVDASELTLGTSATTLASGCYSYMFQGCTSLTAAPELPATTLAENCYNSMFYSCSSLTTAPALPATTLEDSCYQNMFASCTSLTTAPALPATTLEDSCYQNMFASCTSLTTAPELPATTLAEGCYLHMFYSCSNLNYIKCLATDISASNCISYWVLGVASTGTFVKAANMTGWPTGNNGIPTNWTVEDAVIE